MLNKMLNLSKASYIISCLTCLFLSILSFLPICVFAQTQVRAVICNKNKEPLPFTNVVVMQKRIGSMTDDNGKFFLSNIENNDTLKITNLSYQTLYIPIKKVKNDDTIFLVEDIRALNEVLVRDWGIYNNESKLGYFTYSKHGAFMLDPGSEIGIFIENPKRKKALIKKVYFGVKDKGNSGTAMRVRLFAVNDSDGEPALDILNDNVIINSDKLEYRNYIDLSDYKLLMPANGIFVIIEFVSSPTTLKGNKKTSLSANLNIEKNLVWLNFRDRKWAHSRNPRSNEGFYMTPDIGLEVSYPTK